MVFPSIRIPRPNRRAILIYVLTIVLPVCGLLWLGIQSFDRQREAIATLTAEKLTVALEARLRDAAEAALTARTHPIAEHFFTVEHGEIVRPALRAPLPREVPPEFGAAERLELGRHRPDLALAAYRKLSASAAVPGLALSRVARCLTTLGRTAEGKAAWQQLAARYPDERDLSGRPYGIVGAFEAGETEGLAETIAGGRWELSADHAEYFLSRLAPGATFPYLDQFRFARQLAADFRPAGGLNAQELRSDRVAGHRIFYRADGPDRVVGFAARQTWIESTRRQLQAELGVTNAGKSDVRMYGGAVALVSLLLSGGVVLLARDTSREARTNRLRAEFVSGVSHELKTPITLVRLYG